MPWMPRLHDTATVTVWGQPTHSKQTLYRLALSTIFGIVQRIETTIRGVYIATPSGYLQIEYNAEDNWVKCSFVITQSMEWAFSTGTKPNPYSYIKAYNGPDCSVIGAPFGFTGRDSPGLSGAALSVLITTSPGIPRSSFSYGAPLLEFNGRTVLTDCSRVLDPTPSVTDPPSSTEIDSPNPKPPLDNRSRGGAVVSGVGFSSPDPTLAGCCEKSLAMIPLVYAALTDPGGLDHTVWRPPTSGPTGD